MSLFDVIGIRHTCQADGAEHQFKKIFPDTREQKLRSKHIWQDLGLKQGRSLSFQQMFALPRMKDESLKLWTRLGGGDNFKDLS